MSDLYTKLDGLDDAIIGVSTRDGSVSVLAYSVEKIIEILINDQEMDRDEAWEFFDFNISQLSIGEKTPLLVYDDEITQDEAWLQNQEHIENRP